MLLLDKVAVIYGAGGSIGSTVSRSFAKQGAVVYVVGRTLSSLQKLAAEINKDGGKAIAAQVDATDENSVQQHLDEVIRQHNKIDISFNLIGINNKQNISLTEMHSNDFVQPVTDTLHTQFITSTAAGRIMMQQKSGVILSLTATPGGVGYPGVGGFGAAVRRWKVFLINWLWSWASMVFAWLISGLAARRIQGLLLKQ